MDLITLFNTKATDSLKIYVGKSNPEEITELQILMGYNNHILSLHRELMYNPSEKLRVIASKELNYLVSTFEFYIQQYLQSLKNNNDSLNR